MKPELSYKALKLYASKFGVQFYKPDLMSYSFIPLFKRVGYVWIHCASVVRYCHMQDPAQFGVLNQLNIIQVSDVFSVMNNGRATRSFRLIKIEDFEKIIGVEVNERKDNRHSAR